MRDLEIRGAGNLLGTGQSGHIAAVGYDLYCQMVTEAVAELKGEPPREPAEIKLDLPLDAHLPKDYVATEELRLEAYRRLAAVTTAAEVDDIRRPSGSTATARCRRPAEALLAVARLRAECVRTGVREVTVTKGSGGSGGFGGPKFVARISPGRPCRRSKTIRLDRLYKGAVYKAEVGQLQLPDQEGRHRRRHHPRRPARPAPGRGPRPRLTASRRARGRRGTPPPRAPSSSVVVTGAGWRALLG